MAKRVMSEKCRFLPFSSRGQWHGVALSTDKESAIDKVPYINCPIFFINGSADTSVPPQDAYDLFAASNNPLDEIWIADGAKHSQSYMTYPEEYVDRIVKFLSERKNSG